MRQWVLPLFDQPLHHQSCGQHHIITGRLDLLPQETALNRLEISHGFSSAQSRKWQKFGRVRIKCLQVAVHEKMLTTLIEQMQVQLRLIMLIEGNLEIHIIIAETL